MLARAVFPGPLFTNKVGATYRTNGRSIFIATISAAVAIALSPEAKDFASSGGLGAAVLDALTGAQIVSLAISVALLVVGRLARGAHDHFAVDLFMGILENPRLIPGQTWTDLKFVFESQALVSWIAMDVALLARGVPSYRLLATITLHTAYVAHHFADESFLLNTLDFVSEPMGFMLTWGNIVFVGFSFALPAWTAAQAARGSPADLSPLDAMLIVAAGLYGLLVFSQSNHQKHEYRSDPTSSLVWGTPPRTLPTARGTKLLLSGWFGIARHANYLGDLLLALSIALAAGTSYFTSWTYFSYLLVLLIHRARRDDAFCAHKYGADWDTYKEHVPYIILPGIW
jgi:protein-S-isoprenylcysteine O-methyltransferase Ste14